MNKKGFFFFWWGGDKLIQESLTIKSKCKFCKKEGEKYLFYYFTRYTMYSIIPFGRKKLKAIEFYCPNCGFKGELVGEDFSNAEKIYVDFKGTPVISDKNIETKEKIKCSKCKKELIDYEYYDYADGTNLCPICEKKYGNEWLKKSRKI